MEHTDLDATHNRPEGDRPINSAVLSIDIPSYIEQIKNENAWHENDRNAITVFKSDKMRIVLVALHRKAEIQTAHPDNVLSIQVLKGKISVIADEKETEADTSQIIALHDKIPYKIKALKKSLILLTVVE
jgi:quercetin dioxygenase-like cupin family protein